jgi:hypothetical protein
MAMRAAAAARLLKAFATQMEALRRLRNGGSQFVRVEHVHVNEGGRAIVGNVSAAQAPVGPARPIARAFSHSEKQNAARRRPNRN